LRAIAAIGVERRKDAGQEAAGEAAVVFGIGEALGFESLDDRGLRGGVEPGAVADTSRRIVDRVLSRCPQLRTLHFADALIDMRLGATHQGGFAADFDRERVSCSHRCILGGAGGA